MATQTRARNNSVTKPDGEMTVADLANLMQTQFAHHQQSAKEDLKKLGASISSLRSELSTLRDDIASDMEKLREEHKRTISQISTSIDKTSKETSLALDRTTRMNDLVVSGIPFVDGENLISYFHAWCKTLGYAENNFPLVDIRRLSRGPLAAGKIGFSVNKRIYVNENLGPSVRDLRSKALQLKKEGKLNGVFTRGGILFVKRNGDEKEIAVSTESDFSRKP